MLCLVDKAGQYAIKHNGHSNSSCFCRDGYAFHALTRIVDYYYLYELNFSTVKIALLFRCFC